MKPATAIGIFAMAFTVMGAAPVLAQTGLAQTSRTPDAVCLDQQGIYDWQPLNDKAVIALDRAHHKFRVNFRNVCQGLDFKFGVAFRSRGSDLSCISRGDSVLVSRGGPIPPQDCVIDHVDAYTPAMERADAAARAAAKMQH